jgi:hypothetical protein
MAKDDRFNGSDYVPMRDDIRLTGQLLRVWNVVKDGARRTLDQIAKASGDPAASVSAQLRHLRKKRFGAHEVHKEYIADGLYEYWVTPNNSNLVR